MKITLGADPEFFLSRNKEFVAAVGLVPGTKEKPFPLKNGAVQLDGTAVEFNIAPAETPAQFSNHIIDVLEQIRGMIPKDYSFEFVPSVMYSTAIWNTIPDSAKELGCNPDYDAFNGSMKVPPALPEEFMTMRTGAGHLHIGFTEVNDPTNPSHLWDCIQVVQALDRIFGAFVGQFDTDNRRAMLYGQRGSFRPKPYGVEYRVLSNAWLKYPDLWPWMFNTVQCVMDSLDSGREVAPFYGYAVSEKNSEAANQFGRDKWIPFETSMLKRKMAI